MGSGMRWVVLAGVMAVAGCAAGRGDTPYVARLKASCVAGNQEACESAGTMQTARMPTGRSGGGFSDPDGLALDVLNVLTTVVR